MPNLSQSPERHDEIVFVVKLKQFGRHDAQHVLDVASVLCKHINRGFGMDRAEVWYEGKRVIYDPLAADGEHVGHTQIVMVEEPPLPPTNGKVS